MCDCVCDFVMIWCQTFRIERDRWFCCCDSLCFLQETNGASVRTPTSLRMKDKEAAPSVVVRWQSVPQWKNAQSIFGDIFIQLKLFQMSHFIRASVCILKCCRLMSVFMCLCVCTLAFGPLTFKFNVGLVAARLLGQRSGLWHQRNIQGGGSKFTRHPDCPRLHPSRLLIGWGLLRGMHPLPPRVWTWDMKKQESDLNWPLPLTTHLVLMAKGQGFN